MASLTSPSLPLGLGGPARWLPAAQALDGPCRALLLWLPGGGFTGDLPAATTAGPELMAQAGADVVVLAPPRPPQHPFPAGVSAAFEALQALAAQALAAQAARLMRGVPTALFVGGEDAGGNLAAALGLMARDQQAPALAGQVLVLPMLDPRLGSASMRRAACGDDRCPYTLGWKAYLGDDARTDHPYAVPLNASRLAGLAPTFVLTASGHPLSDESHRYAAALRAQGSVANEVMLGDLATAAAVQAVHAFLSDAARRSLG